MKKERKSSKKCLMVNSMRQILRRVKRMLRILGAIILLIYYRIKYIGKSKGIAQIVESFNSGGLEQVAANIYKTYEQNNTKSFVICLSNNVGPMCQQLKSPAHLRIVYYDLASMIKFCAKNNINTLIFHFTTYHMIFFKLLGFKNYYIIHNTYLWYTKSEWKKLKIKLKFTKGIIAVSEWCKDYFIRKTGIENIKVILNGIDFDNLNNSETSSINRQNLKIKDDEIVCLTIGSYTDGKHQMALIGIAEEVLKENKKIKFVSAGPILNKKLYKLFLKNLEKSKAKNNIIVLNYIPQEEIGDFINKVCDIYLQPSIHEAGVPLTVMEALLKGKPVIMTDFKIKETFPNSERIVGVTPPYKDILQLTVKDVEKMTKQVHDRSTKGFAENILDIAANIDNYKTNFQIKDYQFLSKEEMGKKYLKFIKVNKK